MTKKHPYESAQYSAPDDLEKPEDESALLQDCAEENPEEDLPPPCPRCQMTEEAAARLMAEVEEIRLRSLAETDNTRKRMQREKEEAVRYSASAVLADILPALDNLDLALDHAKNNEACKDLLIGVDMTRKLLLEALKKHGLEQVGSLGEVFDPNIHEAVSIVDSPDTPDGSISALLTRGYKLHERLLRPARVVVCKKAQA